MDILKHIKRIEMSNKEQMEKLKESISKLKKKSFPTCWYGRKCRRLYCMFDHSGLFRKVNKRLENCEQRNFLHADQSLCEKCGNIFNDHQSCKRHLLTCHEESHQNIEDIFACQECDVTCRSRTDLNLHVIQNHEDKAIECEQCGIFFINRKELNDHRRNHKINEQQDNALSNMLKVGKNDIVIAF